MPEYFWIFRTFHGVAGLALDLLTYIGFVIVMLGLFGATQDRVEKTGIVACFANIVIIRPLQILFPAYAAAMWWVNLGFLLVLLIASFAILLKLSQPPTAQTT